MGGRPKSDQLQTTSEETKSVEVSSAPSLINQFSHLYLAPEMILSEGANRSVASDVWSIGVLFYTMSCGRLPFAGIHQIINQSISWTYAEEVMNIKLSSPFKSLVSSMLDKEPANRPSLA